MEDDDTRDLRYARQRALPGWGDAGQARLGAASVHIVGLGGLGAPLAAQLAAAGVGRLTLHDFDWVDLSNLPRQSLYTTADIGRRKTEAARVRLAERNPNVELQTLDKRIDAEELTERVSHCEVVVDCSDNFATRLEVNRAALAANVSHVAVAAIRYEGQLFVRDRRDTSAPCYRCIYRDTDETLEDCAGQGVFTPLLGTMAALASAEVLKLLLGRPPAPPRMLFAELDGGNLRWVTTRRRPDCPDCAHRPDQA